MQSSSQPQSPSPTGLLWRLFVVEFKRDGLLLRSSALAYSTLTSLVPIFAIILAVLSGPAFEESREAVLDKLAEAMVPNSADHQSFFFDSSSIRLKQSFRDTIVPLAEKAGTVSVFGFLLLALTAGFLFRTVEDAFNIIWRAQFQRSFFIRVAIATGLIFWGPVLLAVSVSLTEKLQIVPVLGTYLLPTLFTTVAFTAFYMIIPNAKVHFGCALIGGVVAALCWEISKHGFLLYVSRVVDYSKVYGSLGLIPMLFLWVYVNWLLVLSGAEVAYCLQFRKALGEQWAAAQKVPELKQAHVPVPLVLALAIEVVRRFRQPQGGGLRVSQLAESLRLEVGQVSAAAQRLVSAGILLRVADGNGGEDPRYVPACDPASCSVATLLAASRDEQIISDGAAWRQARHVLAEQTRLSEVQFRKMTLAELAEEKIEGELLRQQAAPGLLGR